MMPPPRPLDRYAVMLMAMLCGSWGFNQVAAKLALVDFGPITQAGLRSVLGSVVVGAYAWRFKPEIWRRDGTFAAGLAVGLAFALEFVLLFVAVKLTTAVYAIASRDTAPSSSRSAPLCFCRTSDCGRTSGSAWRLALSGVAAGLYRPAAGSSLLGDLLAIALPLRGARRPF